MDDDKTRSSADWELTGVDASNSKKVLDLIARTGPMNRRAIGERLGIGRTTLSRAISTLLDARVLLETDTVPSGMGRPLTLLSANPHVASVIGFDFGLRHIRGAIVDIAHNVLATREVILPIDYSIEAAVAATDHLLADLEAFASGPVLGVGVALPGPMDRSQRTITRSSILPTWADAPVLDALAKRIDHPVLADNESNLAAYAENLWGAATDVQSMIFLKLHSGVGGAALVHGQVMRGQRGAAGEFGHLSRNPRGRRCRCGNRGCLEAAIGIPRLLERVSRRRGEEVDWSGFVDLVRDGDPVTSRVLDSAGRDAGRALGTLANALDPECIVVGGALLSVDAQLIPAVRSGYRESALPMHADIPVRTATLGRFGSALGACALVLTSAFNDLVTNEISKGRRRER